MCFILYRDNEFNRNDMSWYTFMDILNSMIIEYCTHETSSHLTRYKTRYIHTYLLKVYITCEAIQQYIVLILNLDRPYTNEQVYVYLYI